MSSNHTYCLCCYRENILKSSTDISLDIRIIKTNKAIIKAFADLLIEKDFKKITVQEICEKALVNRGTFYAHFEDKYQLLMQALYDKMSAIANATLKVTPSNSILDYYKTLCSISINYLYTNEADSRMKLKHTDINLVFESMHSFLLSNITRLIDEKISDKRTLPIPINIFIEFFAGGLVALIKWWLISDVKLSKAELEKYSSILLTTFLDPFHRQ